ncbi:hypothetical protein GX51_06367 [Blastomyces parvus]|uniref:Ecp2 effector protein domain-containing protein n=1 Tax=Blastomyces parvus TaxID=2060905 RepID=A0A2B7WS80_9EURO|nr:hypothetical protein GX51_06367 [Blastomyces parvus]
MKFSSPTLLTLTGLLSSALALPNLHPKSEVSTSHAGIDSDERISTTINTTEHNLSARDWVPELFCFGGSYSTWAVDGNTALAEVGKKQSSIMGKDLYEVVDRFCSENNGKRLEKDDDVTAKKVYWFPNAMENFDSAYVPVTIGVFAYGPAGVVDGKFCHDTMTEIISGCIEQGRSRFDRFGGGGFRTKEGWKYRIYCEEERCHA